MSESAVESDNPSFNKSEGTASEQPESVVPAAPRGRRLFALGSLGAVAVAAWLVAFLLFPRARFALVEEVPIELGALESAPLDQASPTSTGSWVHARGTPHSDALSFKRMGRQGSFILTHAKKRPNVWLLLPVAQNGIDPDDYVPPTNFAGRLVKLQNAGLFLSPIRDLIEARTANDDGIYLLIDGTSPRSQRPALVATLLLALLGTACLIFAVHLCRAAENHRPIS